MMQLRPTPSIRRRVNLVKPKVEIVIACEGRVTEKAYLNSCRQYYGAGMVKLRWLPKNGVPMTVVRTAVEERQTLLARAKKSKDSFEVFRVWAVFDRDDHPEVEEALTLAARNGVDVAFSNPCFELWPLLHLMDYGGAHGRHQVQAMLNKAMPGYHHEKTPVVDFNIIKDNFDVAFSRAEILKTNGGPYGCPTTTVGILVKKIIENGRGAMRKNN